MQNEFSERERERERGEKEGGKREGGREEKRERDNKEALSLIGKVWEINVDGYKQIHRREREYSDWYRIMKLKIKIK